MTFGEINKYVAEKLEQGIHSYDINDWRPAGGMYIEDIAKSLNGDVYIPDGIRYWLKNGDSVIYVAKNLELTASIDTVTSKEQSVKKAGSDKAEETMKPEKDITLLELAHIAAENKVRIELTIDAEGNETISAEPWVPFKYTCPQAKAD